MRTTVVLVAILAGALGSIQAALGASVPFELTDNRMIVQTRINGTGPFLMIVDTGSSGTTVTPAVAQRLHLATKPFGPVSGAGRNRVTASAATLERLSVAGENFSHLPVTVIDMERIQKNIGFTRLDGVIGYDVLQSYSVGIDMDRSLLTLSRSPLPHPANAQTLPLAVYNTLPYIHASIDGIAGTVMFDSGDRSSLTLFRGFAARNGFYDAPGTVKNVLTGFGIGGPLFSDVLRTRVGIFGRTIPNVITRATLDTGGFFATSTNAGSIGLGLMKRFDAVLDYPHHTITAWPSRRFALMDRYDPAGMWVSNGMHGPTIAFVAKGGSAERASLQAGDALLSLNGRDVRNQSAIEIRDWLAAQPEGTRVSVIVRTATGQTVSRTVVLHDRTLD